MSNKISPFLKKAYGLVMDPATDHAIKWQPDGRSFCICDADAFRKILPLHFKHDKVSSFVRQLNMYGMKKIGAPRNREFFHELFQRGRDDLLCKIERKGQRESKQQLALGIGATVCRADVVSLKRKREVLQSEVVQLSTTHAKLSSRLCAVESDNARLRDDVEVALQNQKVMEQTLSTIVAFLQSLPDANQPAPAPAAVAPLPISAIAAPVAAPTVDDDAGPPRKKQKVDPLNYTVMDDSWWDSILTLTPTAADAAATDAFAGKAAAIATAVSAPAPAPAPTKGMSMMQFEEDVMDAEFAVPSL